MLVNESELDLPTSL